MADDENERTIWDITPHHVDVELTEGNISIRERALYDGHMRVAKAMEIESNPEFCWLYVHAESRDGCTVKLNREQTVALRDALDECIGLDTDA